MLVRHQLTVTLATPFTSSCTARLRNHPMRFQVEGMRGVSNTYSNTARLRNHPKRFQVQRIRIRETQIVKDPRYKHSWASSPPLHLHALLASGFTLWGFKWKELGKTRARRATVSRRQSAKNAKGIRFFHLTATLRRQCLQYMFVVLPLAFRCFVNHGFVAMHHQYWEIVSMCPHDKNTCLPRTSQGNNAMFCTACDTGE